MSHLASTAVSGHIVGGKKLLPGVGYIEISFCVSRSLGKNSQLLNAVTFTRPFLFPEPRCVLKYTRLVTGAFELAVQ